MESSVDLINVTVGICRQLPVTILAIGAKTSLSEIKGICRSNLSLGMGKDMRGLIL